MTSAVRGSGVPSRDPPTVIGARGRPCGAVGTGWDSRRQPVPTACDESFAQLSGRMSAVPPTRPAKVSALTSRNGFSTVGRHSVHPVGEPFARSPSSCGNTGSEPNTHPRRLPLVPTVMRPRRCQGRQGYPLPDAEKDPFPGWGRGLPCRVICLTAGQHRQQPGCRREAHAPGGSWCLSTCLTPPPPPSRGHHDAGNTALDSRRTGVYPRYRAGQEPLPQGST
jgi:hypothetical protein